MSALNSTNESMRDRAKRLLRDNLPTFKDRDEAVGHLCYLDTTGPRQIWTVAAALYILNQHPQQEDRRADK